MHCNTCKTIIEIKSNFRKHNLCRRCYQLHYRKHNSQKIKELNKQWYLSNREQDIADSVEYQKKRKQYDPGFRILKNLRLRVRAVMIGNYKSGCAVKNLGCNSEELKVYLESKFQPGMSWDNYGKYGWHIDHIKPLCSFNLQNEEELSTACHYTNLQPLWAKDNLKKGGR